MTQVFVWAVAAARKESVLPVPDVNHLLLQAADLSTRSRDDPRRPSLLKMIACVINKEANDAKISSFVDSTVNDLWLSKEDHDRRKESLELISWVLRISSDAKIDCESVGAQDACEGI
jgi:RNAPII transcription regulator C-terminal